MFTFYLQYLLFIFVLLCGVTVRPSLASSLSLPRKEKQLKWRLYIQQKK